MPLSVTDRALVLGSTLRLTRLVVTDDLGKWLIKDPLDRWMHQHPTVPVETVREMGGLAGGRMRWHRYLGGLECPFCVGYWVGVGVMASAALAKATGTMPIWRFVAGTLALNEVAANLGVRVGDY